MCFVFTSEKEVSKRIKLSDSGAGAGAGGMSGSSANATPNRTSRSGSGSSHRGERSEWCSVVTVLGESITSSREL